MAKTKKDSVSDRNFVQACVENKSVAQVAKALKLTPNAVYTRMKALREKKVNLPTYERQGRVKDVDGLNALIAELSGTTESESETSDTGETAKV